MEWRRTLSPAGAGAAATSSSSSSVMMTDTGCNNINNNGGRPYLQIVVQPQSKFRFRYKSEMTGKHGSLLGTSQSQSSSSASSSFHPSEKNSAAFHSFQNNLLLNNLNKSATRTVETSAVVVGDNSTNIKNFQYHHQIGSTNWIPRTGVDNSNSLATSNHLDNGQSSQNQSLSLSLDDNNVTSIDLSTTTTTTKTTGFSVSVINSGSDHVSLTSSNANDNFTGAAAAAMTSCAGSNSKIYPTVKLHNFSGRAIIRCSLVNEAPPFYPHPHVLEAVQLVGGSSSSLPDNNGNHNRIMDKSNNLTGGRGVGGGGVCTFIEIPVSSECNHTAVFQGLNIIYTGKKGMRKELTVKLGQLEDGDERKIGTEHIENCMLTANLNVVCLYFEVFVVREQDKSMTRVPICRPVISQPIQHNKSTQTGDLRIVRIDKHTSYCTGDEEVFILVEKVDKHNIQVKFFQKSDHGSEIWKAYAKFSKLDVHHQYAIVFKTPPYRSCDIDTEVDVWLQLERPSDGATSQPIRFKYKPIERLRKMPKRQSSRQGNHPPGSGPSSSKGRPGGPDDYEPGGMANQNLQNSPSSPGGGCGGGDDSSGGSSPSSNAQSVRQGCVQKFPCDMSRLNFEEYTKATTSNVAFTAALSVGEGLHSWAETSDFNFLLHKLRHLLCLVDDNGDNALHAAISNKQREPFLRILDIVTSSPDVSSALNEQNIHNETPVTLAVCADCPEFVQELTERNADLSIPNMDGDNAFHIAVKTNNIPCLRALLRSNKVNHVINKFNYSSMTPLHISVSSGYLEATDMICRAGASLIVQEGTFGRTPLHLAVEKGSITATMLLIQAAGESELAEIVNIQNYRGDTPLHVASSSGLLTICAVLLYYGADPTIENYIKKEDTDGQLDEMNVGQTAIDAATNEEILKTITGNMECWEKIVKACSALLDSRAAEKNQKVFSLDDLQIDSGIDLKDQATYSYSK